MNIHDIYKEKEYIFDKGMSDLYNNFVKDIESDNRFSLADDEMTELFNELLIRYTHKTTPEAEFERVLDEIYER